jgi:4-hydroxyphenylpyruvate dioxygenase
VALPANPLGFAGIEFVEYATSRPQAFGQLLESFGFRAVARHRSREVTLYRQGAINIVVNAHAPTLPHSTAPTERPEIAAIALRVRDAARAYRWVLDRGAWPVPIDVAVMELHIPAIHGVGMSRIYFIDRFDEFSIYDVDFVPVPDVAAAEPRVGLHLFGLVQYVGAGRVYEWIDFYRELLGFELLPAQRHFGILPSGRILQSPCRTWHLQLVEPDPAGAWEDEGEEMHRLAFGTPDVLGMVNMLRARGVEFVESAHIQVAPVGALTRSTQGGVSFELVRDATG